MPGVKPSGNSQMGGRSRRCNLIRRHSNRSSPDQLLQFANAPIAVIAMPQHSSLIVTLCNERLADVVAKPIFPGDDFHPLARPDCGSAGAKHLGTK
jgi:hypothetical protein